MKTPGLLSLWASLLLPAGAQVVDINGVGYMNMTAPPGFTLLSDPLFVAGNTIATAFFKVTPAIPNGFRVSIFQGGIFQSITFNSETAQFEPAEIANQPFFPGQGAFVFNPSSAPLTITFVGEILQGTLTNKLPAGLSLVASIVPQTGTLKELGFPGQPGDHVYLWNSTLQRYETSFFDDMVNDWLPAPRPLTGGEAFFTRKRAAVDWVRTFDINHP